jgi:2-polyprenyl-6-methoxyphenol hydroxylase-like FAD-dependent oxidoreductase
VHRRRGPRHVARSAASAINLAVQDAVAAANILAAPLKKGPVPVEVLRKVQQRRMLPTRLMQAVQIFVQTRIISNCARHAGSAPRPLRCEAAQHIPLAPPPSGAAHRHGLSARACERGNQESEADRLTSGF